MQSRLDAIVASLVALALSGAAAQGEDVAGYEACIAQVHLVGGADAADGVDIIERQFSEAGTLVIMRDAGDTYWRCIGYGDGSVGELRKMAPAEIEAASRGVQRATEEPAPSTVKVYFDAGKTSASFDHEVAAGGTMSYVVNARDGQFLTVGIEPSGAPMSYQILNPDGSFLLDMMQSDRDYRGQLWQSGDHTIVVINNTAAPEAYRLTVSAR